MTQKIKNVIFEICKMQVMNSTTSATKAKTSKLFITLKSKIYLAPLRRRRQKHRSWIDEADSQVLANVYPAFFISAIDQVSLNPRKVARHLIFQHGTHLRSEKDLFIMALAAQRKQTLKSQKQITDRPVPLLVNCYYSIPRAARAVTTSPPTLWRAIYSGALETHRIGNRRIVSGQQILDWLKKGGRTKCVQK